MKFIDEKVYRPITFLEGKFPRARKNKTTTERSSLQKLKSSTEGTTFFALDPVRLFSSYRNFVYMFHWPFPLTHYNTYYLSCIDASVASKNLYGPKYVSALQCDMYAKTVHLDGAILIFLLILKCPKYENSGFGLENWNCYNTLFLFCNPTWNCFHRLFISLKHLNTMFEDLWSVVDVSSLGKVPAVLC